VQLHDLKGALETSYRESGIAVEPDAPVRWNLPGWRAGFKMARIPMAVLIGFDRTGSLSRSPHSDQFQHADRIH
jgi:hypothetical protein